ncbi:PAS domain S-box-containing protein/diguanylate cyclase (GGDEF)-like protein [Roseibium hamelinense]|uniref:PAS domain S-box-containing protein/diguanylate cyclase (GGDEF)-like protein n=1 Tax=Roseibium hamelinense TaxID=150831 RepID=A0A562SLW4_9HYPH|nr:PAS domain S-box protein [Roseibium hamelinense]MTI45073.1 PAS domain S-box protein [Roseibium hamelinense]TWI82337.1 PAS domain S-box-containing protein/diguanylate cyclase (GGDEF)-like protein [Roseibium hamelinense]
MSQESLPKGIHLDLHRSFGALTECVVLTRPDRRILYTNDAAEKTFGYDRHELVGQTCEILFFDKADFEATGDLNQEKSNTSKNNRFTLKLKRRNGKVFTAEVVNSAIFDATSSHVGYLFIARDISDQLVLEALVTEAAKTLEDAINAISEGFALYDKEDRLVVCNEMYRQIYPESAASMTPGTHFEDILRSGLQKGQYDLGGKTEDEWLSERLRKHKTADGKAIEQKLADGRWLNIAERRTRSGGIAGIRTDITPLKDAHAKLAASNENLVRLANTLPSTIIEIDRDGICILANDIACSWFAKTREELLGTKVRELLPEAVQNSSKNYLDLAFAGTPAQFELPINYPDGNKRHVRLEYLPKIDERQRVQSLVACATDISDIKKAEADLKEAYRNMTILANSLSCAISEIDRDGTCIFINEIGASWYGGTPDELVGTKFRESLPEEAQEKNRKLVDECLAGNTVQTEMETTFPDGETRIVEIEYTPKYDDHGDITGLITLSTDITRRKRTEETLAELYSITSTRELSHEEKINLILKLGCEHFNLPFGIISHIIDNRYTVVRAESPNNEINVGDAFDIGDTYCALTVAADGPVAIDAMKSSPYAGHPCYAMFKLETYIGTPIVVDGEPYGTINFTSPDARITGFSQTDREIIRQFADWVGHEIARQQDQEALMEAYIRLERISSTDDLTGVLNRRAFLDRAGTELARFRRTKRAFTTVMMDIDHFKSINDTYGHAIGDAVLQKFADIVKDSLRSVDVFGRVGGEEFCILLDSSGREAAFQVTERIRKRIADECIVEPLSRPITCSVGLSAVRDGDVEFSTILQRADGALYKAKEQGRNRCVAYSSVADELAPIE